MIDYGVKICYEKASFGDIKWVHSQRMLDEGAFHGLTMRHGGISQAPFDGLNLGWNRDEPQENIKENYQRLCNALKIDYDSMALACYAHGDGIEIAQKSDCGKGFGRGAFPICDALITNDSAVTLITLHADCMPIFLYEPQKKCAAMIHAGWKGASLRIAQKTARKMIAEMSADEKKILAFIGPSISPDRFEVEAPVMDVFKNEFSCPCIKKGLTEGKYYIDLWKIMIEQLFDAGLKKENIELAGICTYDNTDYFSYRRDKRVTGAMAGFMKIST